jgi:hypothetical protein
LGLAAALRAFWVDLSVVHVERSTAELEEIQKDLLASGLLDSCGSFTDFVAWYGINPMTNTVEVGIRHVPSELVAKAARRYGTSVVFVGATIQGFAGTV